MKNLNAILEVLARELDPNGLARFLEMNRSGSGNYTRDRDQWLNEVTLDQILHSMSGHQRNQ